MSPPPAYPITVVVPSYRRPAELERCLCALERQTAAPDAVIVVVRDDDFDNHAVVREHEAALAMRMAKVDVPGQVQALNAGLALVRTPLVAITDDDAAPRPDWLERILAHFKQPSVGAVGGRDVVHFGQTTVEGRAAVVGRVEWFGRVIGNHHLSGPEQDVQFLKGANMSYRCEALAGFDENLAGDGSQICNDMQASLHVSTRGYRVVWDPKVIVDHRPAERFDDDRRAAPTLRAVANILHNQTYILLSELRGVHKVSSFLYAVFVGTRWAPGPIGLPRAALGSGNLGRVVLGLRANWQGRRRGLLTYLRTRGRPRYPEELKGQWWEGRSPTSQSSRKAS